MGMLLSTPKFLGVSKLNFTINRVHTWIGHMVKPIVQYRALVTLVTIVAVASLMVANRFLPAAYQSFAWGVAIGLLSTLVYVAVTWFFNLSPLGAVIIVPAIGAASRFGFPTDNYFWIGEFTGLAIMIAISLVLPLRTPARPNPPQQRTMPPLEESSPHRLTLPRATGQRADQQDPDR